MSKHLQSVLRAIAPLATALALAGCGGLLPKREPMAILVPQVQVVPDPAWPQADWQLEVGRPRSSDVLDSRRMAVVPTPGRIQVYKGVMWSDSVPEIVQSTLVAAFEDSGRIVAVGASSAALRSQYNLVLELRDCQAVYDTPGRPPQFVVRLNASLVRNMGGVVVANHTFGARVAATATDAPAVALAFDAALANVAHDVVGWTLSNGNQAQAAVKTTERGH